MNTISNYVFKHFFPYAIFKMSLKKGHRGICLPDKPVCSRFKIERVSIIIDVKRNNNSEVYFAVYAINAHRKVLCDADYDRDIACTVSAAPQTSATH